MKTTQRIHWFVKRQWGKVAVGLALTVGPSALGNDVHLDMLKTRTDTFKSVTVMGQSKTDIFIRHSRGLGNVKIINITDNVALRALGLGGQVTEEEKPAVAASAVGPGSKTIEPTVNALARANLVQMRNKFAGITSIRPTPNIITLVVAFVAGTYLFFCHCLKLICQKTGNEPGILIWVPILQMLPLLRAAGMSGWWFVGFLIPLVNLITQIVWCFKIVQARGKSVWAAIGLLLPVTNLVALLYLAFSEGNNGESSAGGRIAVAGAPLLVEA
jgi:hypothetical protein